MTGGLRQLTSHRRLVNSWHLAEAKMFGQAGKQIINKVLLIQLQRLEHRKWRRQGCLFLPGMAYGNNRNVLHPAAARFETDPSALSISSSHLLPAGMSSLSLLTKTSHWPAKEDSIQSFRT